jgi:hypothetical protein
VPKLWITALALGVAVALLPSAGVPPIPERLRDGARELTVIDGKAFKRALRRAQPGDVLRLANGTFPKLSVKNRRFSSPVRIAGSGATKLDGLSIRDSHNVVFEDLLVTPSGPFNARVNIQASSAIGFARVRFVGVERGRGVELDVGRSSSEVWVEESEFTRCRKGRPCLQPGGKNIRVANSRFHDCFDCDFVRGGGSGVTLAGNVFERALRERPGNHNDLIQIMGGGPWTMVGNRFGELDAGAAQIYINPHPRNDTNPIHDVRIVSNVFTGDMYFAVRLGVGRRSVVGAPRNVSVINNTILSGRASAVFLTRGWQELRLEQRPLLANNIFAIQGPSVCARARTSSNLILQGRPCSADDVLATSISLDALGRPTSRTSVVIDRADATHAPPTDFYGRGRKGIPDIGAIEVDRLDAR